MLAYKRGGFLLIFRIIIKSDAIRLKKSATHPVPKSYLEAFSCT